jgi:hypothetical protein
MHFSKGTARVLVCGPLYLGGLEFGMLHHTAQGTGEIILLIRQRQTPGQPHDLLIFVLDCFQYMAGVGFDIMENTTTVIPHLEGIWMPTARVYLRHICGSLKIRLRAK